MRSINQFDIWLANLNPGKGTEPGKTRPVVIVQTDLLNPWHTSTIICPVTSNFLESENILRISLRKNQLDKKSDVLIDQLRAIDNKRLIKRIGSLASDQKKELKEKLRAILDLDF